MHLETFGNLGEKRLQFRCSLWETGRFVLSDGPLELTVEALRNGRGGLLRAYAARRR
jgi:hypothetical protein